jgi:putative ABC transport system permease protein
MIKGGFFFRSAVTHLRRGGQRNLVAFCCVVFGVMSLVAMTTMSKSIEKMMILKPVELIGGDLTLDRELEDVISPAEQAQLQDLKQSGAISDYTLMDYSTSLAFHLPGSGELIFPSTGMGVDQEKYPLAGSLTIREPKNKPLTRLLVGAGDVVITRDLALEYHLKVGDEIYLSDLNLGRPLAGRIRGIASDTPNHQGSKVYYSHETANLLSGRESSANTVLVNAGDPQAVASTLENSGWRVFTAKFLADANAVTEGTMAMGLNDIGLLSLLVGGVGIANTMQVLLRRRRKEVAVWKTLGYTGGQIQRMFVLEAFLLGLGGSLVGSLLGVLLSYGLVGLFSRTTTVLIQWVFSPVQAVAGVVIGTLTTVIFAAWAIIATSRVRPLALLRNELIEANQLPLVQGIGLAALLAVPFLAMAVWVLGSFWIGILVLVVSVLGLVAIGFGLWGLVWLAIKLMPMNLWPMGRISRNNLRKRGPTLVFAMVALFIGVMALGFGAVIVQSGQNVMTAVQGTVGMENLAIYSNSADEAAVAQTLQSEQVGAYATGHTYPIQAVKAVKDPDIKLDSVLEGRSEPGGYVISGAAWGSRPDGVYASKYLGLKTGTLLEITSLDGATHQLEVVGSYQMGSQEAWPGKGGDILVADSLGSQLSTASNSMFYLKLNPSLVTGTAKKLGHLLPHSTVISMPDYEAHFVRQYQNLFVFAAAMAGLAILAGILLMANSVSLAMLDRRYEIGVLKAVGYSHGRVLMTQVVEYTLMSVIISLVALGLIWGLLALIGMGNQLVGSLLLLSPSTAAAIAGFTIGLTLITVLVVTWKPTRVSPVIILNDRE